MKHIMSINELFKLGRIFNKDEETAEGILNSIDKNIKIEIAHTLDNNGIRQSTLYSFNIDGFSIEVSKRNIIGYSKPHQKIKIDGVEIEASNRIISKIINKCDYEINREKIEMENYTKKDAKMHFKNRNRK